MSTEWGTLSAEQKAKFEGRCAVDKERYNKEMTVYKEKVKAEEATQKKPKKSDSKSKPKKDGEKGSKGLLGKKAKPGKTPPKEKGKKLA